MSKFTESVPGPSGPVTIYFEEVDDSNPSQAQAFAEEDSQIASLNAAMFHPVGAGGEDGDEEINIAEVDLTSGGVVVKRKTAANAGGGGASSSSAAAAPSSSSTATLPSSSVTCSCLSTSFSFASAPRGGSSLTHLSPSRSVLLGGCDRLQSFFPLSPLHIFDSEAREWKKEEAEGFEGDRRRRPADRGNHSVALEAGGGVETLYLFGGAATDDVDLSDLWTLALEGGGEGGAKEGGWKRIPYTKGCVWPKGRNSHNAIFVPERASEQGAKDESSSSSSAAPARHPAHMLVFGGASTDLSGPTSELWSFTPSTSTWSLLSPSGATPPPREMHSATSSPLPSPCGLGYCMYVFGGRGDEGRVLTDLFRLDILPAAPSEVGVGGGWTYEWHQLPSAPEPRCCAGHFASKASPLGGPPLTLLLFGGFDGETALKDDALLYDVSRGTWTTERVGGEARPCGRMAHATASGGDGEMVIFGGVAMEGDFADVYRIKF